MSSSQLNVAESPESEHRPRWLQTASLAEILRDVRREMGSDTATVLLMDRARAVLEPAATVGLGQATRGAPPVPLGRGFAGRVAQLRRPVVIEDVHPGDVINQILIIGGVKSLVGVPITVGSELLGVLHVGRFHTHTCTDEEIVQLTDLANDLGVALKRRFIDDSHIAALALQRSLLPTTLQVVPDGMEIAVRYVPAEGDLGGDWYDAFRLPGGRMALVMGDVVGHGFEAAIIMGRLRSALRAYALEHRDPAEILTLLDQKICHFEPDCLATVILGIAEEPYGEWAISSAGHFAPMLAVSGQEAGPVSLPIDRLLGVRGPALRRTTRVDLPIDGLLCMFTDGLVERRPGVGGSDSEHDLVQEHLDLLAKSLSAGDDAESACVHILLDVLGDHVAEDDVALLVARRTAVVGGDGDE